MPFPPRSSTALLALLVACTGSDGPAPPTGPRGGQPTITAVEPLAPRQTGVLRGTNLRAITTLTIDGQTAALADAADTELRFTVPSLRPCETDGRVVEIVANGSIRASGRVAARGRVQLQVGESRIVSPADLSCLSFAGEAAAYVLSAHSFSRERLNEVFFRLRSYTVAPDTTPSPFPSFALAAVMPQGEQRFPPLQQVAGSARRLDQAASVTPFDPGYATAQPGDTLAFVDWSKPASVTATSRDGVPTYQGVIVAVAGQQVVVLDLRLPDAGTLLQNAAVRERFRRAAELADRYALPAIQAVVDPSATFPAGAGGRVLTIVQELPPGLAGGVSTADLLGTSYSPWVSDIAIVNLSASFAREPNTRPEVIATTIIHEEAHLADVLAARKQGVASAQGWFIEAIAVAVEERAARMAVGLEHQVTPAQAGADGVPAFALRMPDIFAERYSPWGPVGTGAGATSTGAYTRGLRLVLYAMERLGQTGFTPAEGSLYQRLLAHSPAPGSRSVDELAQLWSIDAIAREAGLSAEALMEGAALGELTDDLVEAAAAAERGLPQFRTWKNALVSRSELQQRASGSHWLPLDVGRYVDVAVPAGSHHFWYVVTEPGRGLSIAATQVHMRDHHRVRVTRMW